MILQAALDDSGNQPDRKHDMFVLGGFISTADRWMKFAADWDAALKKPPGLAYFKCSEAFRMRGEFDPAKGWTPELRNERLSELCEIIEASVMLRTHVAMRHDHFVSYMRSRPLPERTLTSDSPFIYMFAMACAKVATTLYGFEQEGPCDLFFDTQEGFTDEALYRWPAIKRVIERTAPNYQKIFPSPPTFRREEDFLPIQAADFFSGHIRALYVRNRILYMPPAGIALRLAKIRGDQHEMTRAEMAGVGQRMAMRNARFRMSNPSAKLVHYDKATAKRARWKQKRGRPTS